MQVALDPSADVAEIARAAGSNQLPLKLELYYESGVKVANQVRGLEVFGTPMFCRFRWIPCVTVFVRAFCTRTGRLSWTWRRGLDMWRPESTKCLGTTSSR